MMSDLAEFLRARLDEDEAVARAVIPNGRPLEDGASHWFASSNAAIGDRSGYVVAYSVDSAECREHIARHDPAHVLREVEAKRRILWLYEGGDAYERSVIGSAVEAMAAIYADHPDCLDEWKPTHRQES